MAPELLGSTWEDLRKLSGAGMVTFVPWHLTRGTKLDLNKLSAQLRASAPKHLRGFADREDPSGHRTPLGWLWVYRYRELVLERRYPKQTSSNVMVLDRAFGEVMGLSEEWVKRIRLELNKVLNSER
jgi:hypothetical protein